MKADARMWGIVRELARQMEPFQMHRIYFTYPSCKEPTGKERANQSGQIGTISNCSTKVRRCRFSLTMVSCILTVLTHLDVTASHFVAV